MGIIRLDTRSLMADAASALFGKDVAVAVTDPREQSDPLWPEEAAQMTRAHPRRLTECAAGRSAARQAMVQLGLPSAAIPMGADRAPIWPEAVTGSISHSGSLCIAVLAKRRHLRAIGVDLEENTPLDRDLIDNICTPTERARIAGSKATHLAKLIFCAKEATYKAQYALTGVLLGFDQLEVTLDLERHRFNARFLTPAGSFALGDTLPGRFALVAGHLVTGVAIGQASKKGS